jgi:DNA-binding transcriptional ArsR family regulator
MSRPTATPCPLPEETLIQAAAVLRVLGHPHRLRLVELLMTRRRSVNELAEELDLAQSAVSQHLGHMRAQGIVDAQRNGRCVWYRIVNPNACNVIRCIRRHGDGRSAPSPRGRGLR